MAKMLKTTVSAAAVSLVLSFGIIYFDSVKSYAASDFEQRMPFIQQRIYCVKMWIWDKFADEFEWKDET